MSYKVAVVGDKDSIMPFQILGFDIFACRTGQQARAIIRQLEIEQYGVIYVTEQLAAEITDTVAYYRTKSVPALILIPNYKGTLNIGLSNIQENVEKAIGTNIL